MTSSVLCRTCQNRRGRMHCTGCDQYFCAADFKNHRNELSIILDNLIHERDELQEDLKQLQKPNQSEKIHPLISKINLWENTIIDHIREVATNARKRIEQLIIEENQEMMNRIVISSSMLVDMKKTDDFVETDLRQCRDILDQLQNGLKHFTQGDELFFDTTISDQISWNELIQVGKKLDSSPIDVVSLPIDQRWNENGVTISPLGKLEKPYGTTINEEDGAVFITDYANDRVFSWKPGAQQRRIVAGDHGKGTSLDQLNGPTDVLFDKLTNSILVCDYGNRRLMRWSLQQDTKSGQKMIDNVSCCGLAMDLEGALYMADPMKHEVRRYPMGLATSILVAGGHGDGPALYQLNGPFYVAVDREKNVYVSDRDNHRVVKWSPGAQEGIVVAGGHGPGANLNQLSAPLGIVVDIHGNLYVADRDNHRIMCWKKGAVVGEIIAGGKGKGTGSKQLNVPIGLAFDRRGHLYVCDQSNGRVQQFSTISCTNISHIR